MSIEGMVVMRPWPLRGDQTITLITSSVLAVLWLVWRQFCFKFYIHVKLRDVHRESLLIFIVHHIQSVSGIDGHFRYYLVLTKGRCHNNSANSLCATSHVSAIYIFIRLSFLSLCSTSIKGAHYAHRKGTLLVVIFVRFSSYCIIWMLKVSWKAAGFLIVKRYIEHDLFVLIRTELAFKNNLVERYSMMNKRWCK